MASPQKQEKFKFLILLSILITVLTVDFPLVLPSNSQHSCVLGDEC